MIDADARALVDRLAREHVPYTNEKGEPVAVPGMNKKAGDFPTQCRACLQQWECETRRLLDLLDLVVSRPEFATPYTERGETSE